MPDLLAGWKALGKSRQRKIRSAIAAAVVERVQSREAFDPSVTPDIDVVAALGDDERVSIDFVVSCTLSTHDRTEHFVYAGHAIHDRNASVDVDLGIEQGPPTLGDAELAHYDHARWLADVRAAVVAKLEGTPPPPPAYVQLAHIQALVDDERRLAAGPPAAAPSSQDSSPYELPIPVGRDDDNLPSPPSRPPARQSDYVELGSPPSTGVLPNLRCPKCGSRNVAEDPGRAERHFTFVACRDCDHGEEIGSMSAVSRWRVD